MPTEQQNNSLETTMNFIPQKLNKHKSPWRHVLTATYIAAVLAIPVYAGQVTGLNIFQSGQPAKADDVNHNFSTIADAVNDNHARISTLETAVADIKNRLNNLEANLTTPKNIIVSNTVKYTVPQGKGLYIHTAYSTSGESGDIKLNNQTYFSSIGSRGAISFSPPLIIPGGVELSIVFSNNASGELRITGYEK